ncbi:dehypoxanthine futalosine cyclase [bacterium]|nr:Cyclic dehypoxanthine futalosine synthase [bacterium]MCK6495900.1 dehypoxanthine futalosine cyclase [bacterium]
MKRIDIEEALDLYQSADLFDLGEMAHQARLQKSDPQVVTYIVDRNINYTNVCVTPCKFCAFYRTPANPEGYVLPDELIDAKIDELVALGGSQVLLQGGLHPTLPFSYYTSLIARLKEKYPSVNIHAFSPPEIVHFARISGLSIEEVLRELWDAGQRSIPGGGAEILVDRVRKKLAPTKCMSQEWLDVMETAHRIGYASSATMMFGHIETLPERIEHLAKLREVQDRTGGFTAFICWPIQSDNTPMRGMHVGPLEYLRTQALARVFLDNFAHIQSSWVTMGENIGQLALRFGADDMGGTMMEENVVSAASCTHRTNEQQLCRLAREIGFRPQRRNTFYDYLDQPEEVLCQ